MKAILIQGDGALLWTEAPYPICRHEEVVVKIHATAVNRADLLQRKGLHLPPAGITFIPGLECAGEIVEIGGVTEWKIGDRVCALLAGGGYAEYVAIHQDMLLPMPEDYSFEEAAALPESVYTAYLNLIIEGQLKAGERWLIHAGAGGVGTMAIQIAKAWGAEVIATTSQEKMSLCRALGADAVVNYRGEHATEELMLLKGEHSFHGVLAMVGTTFPQDLHLLAYRGRFVLIGLLGGSKSEIDLGQVLANNLRIIGSTLRNRSLEEKKALTQTIRHEVLPLLEKRTIRPVIDSCFPIPDAEKAHERMQENLAMGKIVLTISHA